MQIKQSFLDFFICMLLLFLFVEVTEMQKSPGLSKLPPDRTFHLKGRLPRLRFLSYFPLISHIPPGEHVYLHPGYVGQLFSLETPLATLGQEYR